MPSLILGKTDSLELYDELMLRVSTLGVVVAVLGTTSSLLQNTVLFGSVEFSDGNTEAGFVCDAACKSRIFFLHTASMCPIFLQ